MNEPNASHLRFVAALSEADRRLNVEGRLHSIVSSFGGERIIAGPRMYDMVKQLADEAEGLAREGYFGPRPAVTE